LANKLARGRNLGHDNVLTTVTSYGNLTQHRQDELLERMAKRPPKPVAEHPPRALVAMDPARLDRLERMIADLGTTRQPTAASGTDREI
jgi:hypothetical protein